MTLASVRTLIREESAINLSGKATASRDAGGSDLNGKQEEVELEDQ